MKSVTYIGCYTDEKKTGIHIFESDTEQGGIAPLGTVEGSEDAITLALSSKLPVLYAAQGLPEFGASFQRKNGAVAAYEIDGDSLVPLNRKPIGLTVPCYIALDPAEKALVFAEYAHAVSGVFELNDNGSLSEAPPITVRHRGRGPDPDRQESAHAHCAEVSPDGKYLCVADLGIDRVKVYDFANRSGGLRETRSMTVQSASGSGPRHILFHPNGEIAFLLHELDNTISSLRYTGDALVHVQTIGMLPADFHDFSKASALKLSADGRRLFGSNRGHDSIVVYDIDPNTGDMSRLAISRLAGSFPRDFEFMPGERFALIGHENSNELMSYAYDKTHGKFTPAHEPYSLYKPVCVKFGAQRG